MEPRTTPLYFKNSRHISSASPGKMRAGMRTASPPPLAGLKRGVMSDSSTPSLSLLAPRRPAKFRKLDSNGEVKAAGMGGPEDLGRGMGLRKSDAESKSRWQLNPGGRLERAVLSTGENYSALSKADGGWSMVWYGHLSLHVLNPFRYTNGSLLQGGTPVDGLPPEY